MRVMLDTNILISAIVFQSRGMHDLINYIVTNHELVLPSYGMDELWQVTERKFPQKMEAIVEFLTSLSFTLAYTPQIVPQGLFEMRDESDYPILYTAIIEGVDILISGDKDFMEVEIEKPDIMSASEFMAAHMGQR